MQLHALLHGRLGASRLALLISCTACLLLPPQHAEKAHLYYGDVEVVVLDEADTMFDRGFGPEVGAGWVLPRQGGRRLGAERAPRRCCQLTPPPCFPSPSFPPPLQVKAVLAAVRSKPQPARCVMVSATMTKAVRRLIGAPAERARGCPTVLTEAWGVCVCLAHSPRQPSACWAPRASHA